ILPRLDKNGALTVVSYNQHIQNSLLFIRTQHRLRIADSIIIRPPCVLRYEKPFPLRVPSSIIFPFTVSFCHSLPSDKNVCSYYTHSEQGVLNFRKFFSK